MLSKLCIKNFAIIEDMEVSFYEGINVLMGETGAGKSILIDALSMLMGNRSSFDKIRKEQKKAYIEGEFILSKKEFEFMNQTYDDLIEEPTIVVSRSLESNGKSTSKINYHVVPLSILKEVVTKILDIHSQHKDNSFFDENKQIDFLDSYIEKKIGKSKPFIAYQNYEESYKAYKKVKDEIDELKKKKDKVEDLDYLTFQYNELEKAKIKENELEDVEDELLRLNSFEKLSSAIQEFEENYEDASNRLYQCKKALIQVKDDAFQNEIERFNNAYYEMEDIKETIHQKYSSFQNDIDKIDYLTNRRSELKALSRKYGSTTKEILSKFKNIKEQIDSIENFDYLLEQKNKELDIKVKDIQEKGRILSELRKTESINLIKEINKQLKDLLLENANFNIQFDDIDYSLKGNEKITFLLQANLGSKYLPLNQTASLGESSRLSLALKTVFNALKPIDTIIFDEIDTGISGRVAVATSKKLKNIGNNSQTIIISHLPQVASLGNHHLFVKKSVENHETKSFIHEMDEKELTDEIAKMISGERITEDSLQASRQLIKSINE